MSDLDSYLAACQQKISEALDNLLPPAETDPQQLHRAMRYSVLQGGKRIRPVLVLSTAEALGGTMEGALDPACAIELIHAYSLVHDDLPAMDDDDLRRGQPTCHKAFDEATAILSGDALQALAFGILSRPSARSAETSLAMINTLSHASGSAGMVGGQCTDLEAEGQQLSLPQLESMHRAKTGALIEASVELGALAAGISDDVTLAQLKRFAGAIGLAFQVQDDILDIISDTAVLGKSQGADVALGKSTYPALLGLNGAKQKARELLAESRAALQSIPALKGNRLQQISELIVERQF